MHIHRRKECVGMQWFRIVMTALLAATLSTATPVQAGEVTSAESLAHYRQYRVIDLGTLEGTDPLAASWASDINDFGDVVGGGMISATNWHAALWRHDGRKIDLGFLPGYEHHSNAEDINNHGDIVGISSRDNACARSAVRAATRERSTSAATLWGTASALTARSRASSGEAAG
jgi:uncharacterized membrane protein